MMTLTQLFHETIEMFKPNIGKFFFYNVCIFVIALLGLGAAIGVGIATIGFNIFNPSWLETAALNWYFVAAVLLIFICTALCTAAITIALTRVIHKLYLKQTPGTFQQELFDSKKLIIPALLGTLLYAAIVLGGILLLIIPGIIFSIWFAFSAMSIILDNKKVFEAIKYSKSLVMGRFFITLMYIAVPILCIAVFQGITSTIIHIPDMVAPNNLGVFILTNTLDMAVSLVIAPLSTIPFVILYEELKKNPVTTVTPPQA